MNQPTPNAYADCLDLAWWKYWAGNYVAMGAALAGSRAHSAYAPAAQIADWIEYFTQRATTKGYAFEIDHFTDLPPWKALIAQTLIGSPLIGSPLKDSFGDFAEPKSHFVQYRILGNDLPPRHYQGQTIDNLRFILNYEPPLKNCRKRWIVNTIVDPQQEQAILTALEQTHQDYVHFPFNEDDYRQITFDFESFLEPDFLRSETFEQLDPNSTMWALDRPYRFKRFHLFGLNKRRNQALAEGKQIALWTLVLDGSCLLTEEAWKQILLASHSGKYKHLIIPMVRLMTNQQLFVPNAIPEPDEEPHIAIHHDSQETYDETLHYGRFDKVEFLRRIQVPGIWDTWNYKPWEKKQWAISPEAQQWQKAGWVIRLASGHTLDNDQSVEGMTARTLARQEAVWDLIDDFDEKIFRQCFHANDLLFFNPTTLEQFQQRWQANEAIAASLIHTLIASAEACLTYPVAITAPNDPGHMPSPFEHVTLLALAGYFTSEETYSDHAATLVRQLFLDPTTPSPAAHTQGLFHVLDAIRLIKTHSTTWTETDHTAMQAWCKHGLTRLSQSPQGQTDNCDRNHYATGGDLQVAALASFSDEAKTLLKTLEYSKMRLASQFARDGRPPDDGQEPLSLHSCLVNLQHWVTLIVMCDRLNITLAHYSSPEGQTLEQACQWLLPYYTQPWPHAQAANTQAANTPNTQAHESDHNRFLPLGYLTLDYYPSLRAILPEHLPALNHLPCCFSPATGIAPYWMFALKPSEQW